jgi:hypothetical protein
VTGGRAGFGARVCDARDPVRVFVVLGASVDEVTCQRDRTNRVYNVSVPEWGERKERVMSHNNFCFRAH